MYRSTVITLFALFTLVLFANSARAETHSVGEYTVHYNLLNSSFIAPKIATQYGIKRSKNIGLLNISIIQKSDKEGGTAVISNVFGHGASLAGQVKSLSFKEIKEAGAIYYIATFPINNGERLSFDINVQPQKVGKLIPIKFKKQVFVD